MIKIILFYFIILLLYIDKDTKTNNKAQYFHVAQLLRYIIMQIVMQSMKLFSSERS